MAHGHKANIRSPGQFLNTPKQSQTSFSLGGSSPRPPEIVCLRPLRSYIDSYTNRDKSGRPKADIFFGGSGGQGPPSGNEVLKLAQDMPGPSASHFGTPARITSGPDAFLDLCTLVLKDSKMSPRHAWSFCASFQPTCPDHFHSASISRLLYLAGQSAHKAPSEINHAQTN